MGLFDGILILDGATGTGLQRRGMPSGVCTEKWALEHPDAVIELQRGFADAGSQAVYAPTFGANRAALRSHGLEGDVRDICLRLVALSREAVGGRALVGGDVAPSGLMPEPYGSSSEDEMTDVFAEQARALDEAGVDFFAVETQMYIAEAVCAVKGIRAVSDRPVAVTFACTDTGKTLWGEELSAALATLEPLGIDAFGVNCCGDLELLAGLIAALRDRTELPLIAKPNAGKPEVVGGETVYRMTPESLAAHIPALYGAGATVFGGCCGTHAGHIAAIKDALTKTAASR